ncbi:unnamed protein product [Nippostrongylus brasiliensis]|uniref:C-type lectin domain-containing protein n=1 Tax=Nippostrongylus brasiliensis TaxID=27835 RepID=A0A0N4YCH5_NIPBR|nr:unnamed protein product [Nippostrongylus brasiliensis]
MVISIRFVEFVGLFTLTAAISSHLPTKGFKSNGCPLGWSPYKDCCYFFENRTMSLPKAEKQCSTRGATLIVANSEQELSNPFFPQSNVTQLAGRNHLFWVGLAQFEQHSPPVWQTTSGVEPSKLNWLVKPFSSTLNGWSTVSRCAAFFNGHTESARYLYFHPCESHFQSICERNLTFSSALSQNFGK